jgi:hypothetical protein
MEWGQLSKYVRAVAAKRLSAVEVDPSTSHQHEFNGIQSFRAALGEARLEVPASVLWITDSDDSGEQASGVLKWYDARENDPSRSAEFRLYYPAEAESVVQMASPGDLLVLLLSAQDNTAVIAIAPEGSTTEHQLLWLFGLPHNLEQATSKTITGREGGEISVVALQILEALGIEPEQAPPSDLEALLARFGLAFPSTKEMSAFARSVCAVDAVADPDGALLGWYRREEYLFRGMERAILEKRLERGFNDVDEFLSESLSVHQRRKSRAGSALENHIEAILTTNSIKYSRGKVTERRSLPDFVFPGVDEYRDPTFPADRLTMLASKSTSKERWRQILAEADRIQQKHLLTLEPAISVSQTNEMLASNVRLVIPREIHETYIVDQRAVLITMSDFLGLVRRRETA